MAVARSVLRVIAVAALIIGTVVIVIGAVATPAASTTTPIGPKQHYIGLVNAKPTSAVIYVVCPGPAAGRTGPPAGRHDEYDDAPRSQSLHE
ncbi:MAG: hypothetical protein QOH28_270 [Actinomycetota bacterium]|jgi:hypothetical protein|nr:hypothetical protein [Actinomycetota bacterium]